MLSVYYHKTLVGKIKSIFTTHLAISAPIDTNDLPKNKITSYQLYLYGKSKINIRNELPCL